MSIKVNVHTLDYGIVLDYYNKNKKISDIQLEKLDRCEGGFQFQIIEKQHDDCDSNEKIRQLRWYKGYLIPHKRYETFTEEEILLLFESLKHVLGEENVSLE